MINFLKLIRLPNLLIILFSMVFMLIFLVNPLLGIESLVAGLDLTEFILLIAATIFITIGGYLINDFFDMEADEVNKPGKNQVGRYFPVFTVQILYWVFTIAGVIAGILLSWLLNQFNYSLLFIFCAGLLWFYSERYQCIPLVGNIVVAFLSALAFGIVWLFQFFALSLEAQRFVEVQTTFSLINKMVLIYMAFAFITSFLREVIKDIEDVKGDSRYGCKTFVVAFGQQKAKILAICIALVGLFGSVWFQSIFFEIKFWYLFGYFFVIDLMFVLIIFLLNRAKTTSDFGRLSNLTKALMVAGIISMILFYFEL